MLTDYKKKYTLAAVYISHNCCVQADANFVNAVKNPFHPSVWNLHGTFSFPQSNIKGNCLTLLLLLCCFWSFMWDSNNF